MHSNNRSSKNKAKHPVTFRLTAREHALLKAKADAEGATQGEFLRRIMVAGIEDKQADDDNTEQAAQAALLAAQMTAQVWAHLHVMLRASPTEVTQIETTFAKIQRQYLPSESGEQEE